MKRIMSLCLFLLSLLTITPITTPANADECYILGFKTLYEMIPDKVGLCKGPLNFNQINGDALQYTANGLLVWRKADNWTAFTDGYQTWINGPLGLQVRLNTERFDWEIPTNVTCDNPSSYQNFLAFEMELFEETATKIQTATALATANWNTSIPAGIRHQVLSAYDLADGNFTMIASTAQNVGCVPEQFTSIHVWLTHATQLYLEGLDLCRQGVTNTDPDIMKQGLDRFSLADVLIERIKKSQAQTASQ